jgi:hypothetical protein
MSVNRAGQIQIHLLQQSDQHTESPNDHNCKALHVDGDRFTFPTPNTSGQSLNKVLTLAVTERCIVCNASIVPNNKVSSSTLMAKF